MDPAKRCQHNNTSQSDQWTSIHCGASRISASQKLAFRESIEQCQSHGNSWRLGPVEPECIMGPHSPFAGHSSRQAVTA